MNRICQWAFARLLLEGAAIGLVVMLASRVLDLLVPPEPSALHGGLATLRNLLVAGLLIAVYTLMVRWLERRDTEELGVRSRTLSKFTGADVHLKFENQMHGTSASERLRIEPRASHSADCYSSAWRPRILSSRDS